MAISSPLVAIGAFVVGVGLIVFSVEELVESITKASVLTGLSTFMLAVLFAGLDFENWAFGVASILGDLSGLAIGSALGSGLILVGVAVAVGLFRYRGRVKRPEAIVLALLYVACPAGSYVYV